MLETIIVDDLTSIAQDVKKYLSDSLGVDISEVFGARSVTRTIQFTSTKIFGSFIKEEAGFGIRYQKDGLTYFKAIDSLSLEKVKHILNSSSGNQDLAFSQEIFDFAPAKSGTVETGHHDPQIAELTLQDLFDSVQSISSAVASHRSPFFISSGILMAREVQQTLVNTSDLEHQEKTTIIQLREHLVAGKKDETVFESNVSYANRFLKEFDVTSITLGELDHVDYYTSASRLKGNRILPVIFTSKAMNQIGDNLLRHLLTAKYFPAGPKAAKPPKISEKITIIEDADALTRLGGHVYDHEGVPARSLTLYRDGIPKKKPVDLLTAAGSQQSPTGSTYRGIPLESDSTLHRRPPSISITNIRIKPGDDGKNQLLTGTDKGLEVNGIAKVNYFDVNTGNFELSTTEAAHVKNGEKNKGAGRITIYGNLFELLLFVETVGKNTEPGYLSAIPALKINRMRVLGKPKKGH